MEKARRPSSFWVCLVGAGIIIAGLACFLALPLEPAGAERTVLWSAGSGSGAGWDVYVMEAGSKRALTDLGDGYFSGCSYAGQTFFASCMLESEYENALLEVNSAYGMAIFLDSDLLYATAPVSSADLDTLEVTPAFSFRTMPDLLSLPAGYAGHLLTIAQAQVWDGPEGSEPADEVFLGPIILYGDVTYRTEASSEVARTLYPVVTLAVLGVLVLVAFAAGAWFHVPDAALAFLSGFAFLWMVDLCLRSTSLAPYYGGLEASFPLFYYGSLTCLFLFMAAHMARYRKLAFGAAAAQAAIVVVNAVLLAAAWVPMFLQDLEVWASLAVLCLCVALAFLEAKGADAFYTLFTRLFLAACVIFGILVAAQARSGNPQHEGHALFLQMVADGSAPGYLLYHARYVMIGVCLASAAYDLLRRAIRNAGDAAIMAQRQVLSQRSADQLRRHAHETHLLQHDMRRHLGAVGLYLSNGDAEKAQEYLRQVGARLEAVPPIVCTGNEAVDLLLNAKLGELEDTGIGLDVLAESLPEALPLSETELASLLLNTLDNAQEAASGSPDGWISVQVYVRNGFLCYKCANSIGDGGQHKEPAAGHGYGLRIVQRIADRHDGILEIEREERRFTLTALLPLGGHAMDR